MRKRWHQGPQSPQGTALGRVFEYLRPFVNDWTLNRRDPDGLRYVASVWVWVHWFMGATFLVQLVYRPWYGPERYAAYALLYLDLDASPTFSRSG